MSRNVSTNLIEAVNASETDEAFIILVTIDHADLSEPIRITTDPYEDVDGNDTMGVISRGNNFIALPFELILPNEDEDQSPMAKIKIDNISREIVEAVRTITSPADFSIEIVLASDPDTVEASWTGFQLRNVRYDAFVVEGELTIEQFDKEPFPEGKFTPSAFPGLF
jgi:hypothetical protein